MSSTAQPLPSLLSGTLFGLSLLLSGVFSPTTILSQLRLTNFHMLESFLSASAVSALVVSLASKSGYAPTQIRKPRDLVFGGPYSANILGGAMLGVGMGLTGACPGTVIVQMASGVRSGWWVALGGGVGGAIWGAVKGNVLETGGTDKGEEIKENKTGGGKTETASSGTLQTQLNLSNDTLLLAYELMCLAMIGSSIFFAPKRTGATPEPVAYAYFLPPAVGGLFIGVAQAATLLLTRKTVGVSAAYSELVAGRLASPSVWFALGIYLGSAAGVWMGLGGVGVVEAMGVGWVRALVGGVLSIFGASLAGGCTSGHGISGMATFSTASFITVAAMFGGGIATANLL